MKLVILAGGKGSRFLEQTITKPKPLIEIGDYPIILHIMKYYSFYGVRDFIICSGYKGNLINKFFINYINEFNDINISSNKIKILNKKLPDWNITICRSDEKTNTGGRLLSIKKYIKTNENFYFTYGDGLSDIDLKKQFNFHKKNKKICTISGVVPINKYGVLKFKENEVIAFNEKKKYRNDLINGGFYILNQKIFNFLKNKKTIFEKEVISKLIKSKEINVYKHSGFWQSMDNIREKNILEELLEKDKAPWKKW